MWGTRREHLTVRTQTGSAWLGCWLTLWLYGTFTVFTYRISDPCLGPHAGTCERHPALWLYTGVAALVVSVVSTALAIWWQRQRAALEFTPAPGWPAAPAGWTPPMFWNPDPRWPDPPRDWQFWRGPGAR